MLKIYLFCSSGYILHLAQPLHLGAGGGPRAGEPGPRLLGPHLQPHAAPGG